MRSLDNHDVLVSAVIPAYNAEATLSDAIESVLSQTHRGKVECIVVNDGSSDATGDIARSYEPNVKVTNAENVGVAAARNRGVAAASGDYIGFLDADDAWAPRKIEQLLAALKDAPDAGLAYCTIQKVDEDLRPIGTVRVSDPRNLARNALLLEGPVITAIFGLIPMSVLRTLGGFDERLSTGADAELTCKIARSYRIVGVDEPLTFWRQHDGQMHRKPDLLRKDHLTILHRFLDGETALEEYIPFRNRAYANLYLMLAIAYQREGRARDFRRYLALAIRRDPGRVLERLTELTLERKLRPHWERLLRRRPSSLRY